MILNAVRIKKKIIISDLSLRGYFKLVPYITLRMIDLFYKNNYLILLYILIALKFKY